jgi:biotin carboxyl carrier protein
MNLKYNDIIFDSYVDKQAGLFNVEIEKGNKINGIKKIDRNFFKLSGKDYFRAEDEKFVYISTGDEYYKFEKLGESEKEYLAAALNADEQDVMSPMPGSVVKVPVNVGDKVSEGDPLIIVEAMKMETSLYASIDGIVSEINVESGEQVDTDKILIKIIKE